eukprot:gene2119-2404_t
MLKEIIEKEKKPNIYAQAKGLETEDLDVVMGCERVADLNSAITELRNDTKFELFWEEATRKCKRLDIKEPKEECILKLPRRYEENPSTAVHLDPKANLKVKFYYNILDLMTASISTRFDSHSGPILQRLSYLGTERLDSPEALKKIHIAVDWYKDDLDADLLEG